MTLELTDGRRTAGEWEAWTGMRLRETSDCVFPAGLATAHIDRDNDTGEYWEPGVWVIHHVSGRTPD
jgi:hypothetical protein